MKKYVLIVAGGSGTRMNTATPKQFMEINGKPLLMHTFYAFLQTGSAFEFILVLPENEIGNWHLLCRRHSFEVNHTVVCGGETRFHSVQNGLAKIEGEGIVFIHDGVRPLVAGKTIENCYRTALQKGNALPVISPSESVREVLNGKNRAVDRSRFFLVQTPQTFRVSLIKEAYKQAYHKKFTDDASVVENAGSKIHLVEGNRENIKITFPHDLKVAGVLLQK